MADQLQTRFRIILHSVDSDWTSRVQAELARLFQVEDRIASSIVSSAPIVVFDDMEFMVAIELRRRMQSLVDAGCVFITTDEQSDEVPRINWPEMPEFARQSIEQIKNKSEAVAAPTETPKADATPAHHHLLNRFDCPSCGEHFALYQLSDKASKSLPNTQAPLSKPVKESPTSSPPPVHTEKKAPSPPPPPPSPPPKAKETNKVDFDDPLLKARRASREASTNKDLLGSQRSNKLAPQSPSTRFARDKVVAQDDFKMPEIDDEPFPDTELFDSREEQVVNSNLFESDLNVTSPKLDESGEFSFDPMDDDSGEPSGLFDNAPTELETKGPKFDLGESVVEENIFDSQTGSGEFMFDSQEETSNDNLLKVDEPSYSAEELDALVATDATAPIPNPDFAPPPRPLDESPATSFATPLLTNDPTNQDAFDVDFDEDFDEDFRTTRRDIDRQDEAPNSGFASHPAGNSKTPEASVDLFAGDDDFFTNDEDDDLFGDPPPPGPQDFKETRADDLFAPQELKDREAKRRQYQEEISNVLDGSGSAEHRSVGGASLTQDDLNDLGLGSRRRKSDFSQRSDSELQLAFAEDKVEADIPVAPTVEQDAKVVASGFAFADDDDDDFSDFESVTEMSRSGEFLRSQEDARPVAGFTRGMPFERAIRLFTDEDLKTVDSGEGLITEESPLGAFASDTPSHDSLLPAASSPKTMETAPPSAGRPDDSLSDPFGLTSEPDSLLAAMAPPPPPSQVEDRDPFEAVSKRQMEALAENPDTPKTLDAKQSSPSGEDLRKLDFNETYAMLGDDQAIRRQRRSGRMKQRGLLPMPASDEDFDLMDNKPREAKSTRYKRDDLDPDGPNRAARRTSNSFDFSKVDSKADPFESMPGSIDSSRLPGSQSDSARVDVVKEPEKSGVETNPGDYSLVLSKIESDSKRKEAAHLICSIQGSPLNDAIRLTERTIIPVLKDVSKEDAEKHLQSFRNKDISGRVTRRRGARSRR